MIDSGPKIRIDKYLSKKYNELNRSQISKKIKQGKLRINKQIITKPSFQINPEDKIQFETYQKNSSVIKLSRKPKIIYQDENIIVIDKPPGLLVHSKGAELEEETLADFVKKDIYFDKPTNRSGIVHRLDRATSGVIVVARNNKSLKHLQKQFQKRTVKKKYLAVVEGKLDQKSANIDMPIQRNPRKPQTFRVNNNGKPSQTYYKVLKESPKHSLLELQPRTGRTHQLRVHLNAIGHPIVGDYLYNNNSSKDRMMLHAHAIEIYLPEEDNTRVFKSKIPSEFNKLMKNDV